MADELTIKHLCPPLDDQVRLKLTKNSKGYGWEISVVARTSDEALDQLREVEQRIKEEFGKEDM